MVESYLKKGSRRWVSYITAGGGRWCGEPYFRKGSQDGVNHISEPGQKRRFIINWHSNNKVEQLTQPY